MADNNICCVNAELIVPAASADVMEIQLLSKARRKNTSYFACIPKGRRLPGQLPVLYLLHGPGIRTGRGWIRRATNCANWSGSMA
ncbi:MAG: hypothetical protein HZT40_21355 [Candidatus Thiothrix singaporensis]|uniref:Uncharacterized protein n=1 Tax=Candidatus Thiothrix singaporensis TaxID=2799669 RepID=A0A7L6AXI5_9GAMM|nr:MAG: hypothetical protein HZT40_21355 [Candidatus Thiothrix singaporensis]